VEMSRGDAAAKTWIFRRDEQPRRGSVGPDQNVDTMFRNTPASRRVHG